MGTTQTFLTGEAVRTVLRSSPASGGGATGAGGPRTGVEQPVGRRGERAELSRGKQRVNWLPAAPPRYFPHLVLGKGAGGGPRAAYGAHGRRRESAARMEVAGARGARGGHLEPGGWRRTRRRAGAGRPVDAEASGSRWRAGAKQLAACADKRKEKGRKGA